MIEVRALSVRVPWTGATLYELEDLEHMALTSMGLIFFSHANRNNLGV